MIAKGYEGRMIGYVIKNRSAAVKKKREKILGATRYPTGTNFVKQRAGFGVAIELSIPVQFETSYAFFREGKFSSRQ